MTEPFPSLTTDGLVGLGALRGTGFGRAGAHHCGEVAGLVEGCEAHWSRVAEPWKFRYWFEYSTGTALWANDDATRAEFGGGVSWVAQERLPLSREVAARIHELQA